MVQVNFLKVSEFGHHSHSARVIFMEESSVCYASFLVSLFFLIITETLLLVMEKWRGSIPPHALNFACLSVHSYFSSIILLCLQTMRLRIRRNYLLTGFIICMLKRCQKATILTVPSIQPNRARYSISSGLARLTRRTRSALLTTATCKTSSTHCSGTLYTFNRAKSTIWCTTSTNILHYSVV